MTEFSLQDQSSNHKYRTEIPNIIFELGLKGAEIAVYCAIKRAAGDKGQCTKSLNSLCQQAGVSKPNFIKIKRKLCEKYAILNSPLISCRGRITEHGDQDTNEIIILDIWPQNYTYFSSENGGGW